MIYSEKKCLIITSCLLGRIRDLVDPDDAFVICADGGWDLAAAEDIRPDVVLGDFDSSRRRPAEQSGAPAREAAGARPASAQPDSESPDTRPCSSQPAADRTCPPDWRDAAEAVTADGIRLIRLPAKKDKTDTALCIDYAAGLGFRQILLIGGTGGRADHTVANLQTIAAAARDGISVMLVDSCNVIMALVDDEMLLPARPGWKLSLLSHSDRCTGVCARGVEYPLEDAELTSDFPLGVSNEFTADEAYLAVAHGTLLVMLSRDPQPSD
ncbi:MAG: thiamine diphosphokinase [Anaerovoracaceae bacterium]|jgi:thiamine pyrophosphokinase